ncbi:hypothetical protein [Sanguibacter sp. Z1732]|uniref:hypothetical protein n=1 Tax=Sanguibacter sp. Z1732 TaxID=3435412 RepID=UPI003D9C87EC
MIAAAADVISGARRPLIMLGAAAARPRCTHALSEFVARMRIPFFTTQMGKGTVSGCTDLYLGTAALTEGDYLHEAIDQADVIITIGHDTVEKPPFTMHSRGQTIVHLDYQPATIEEVYVPQVEVIGDLHTPCTPSQTGWMARCPTPKRCSRCVKASSRTSPTGRPKIG